MRQPRIRSVTSGLFVALTLIAVAIGCGSVRTVEPGAPPRSGEGLLVLHIRTDTPLKSVTIGGWARVALDLPSGSHLRVIGLPAGRYRWSRFELPETIDPTRFGLWGKRQQLEFRFRYEEELEFRVEAGCLNYVGLIEIYRQGLLRLGIRPIDRTALALEELRAQFPAYVEQYPIVYSGPGRHVFLERYLAAKAAKEAAAKGGTR